MKIKRKAEPDETKFRVVLQTDEMDQKRGDYLQAQMYQEDWRQNVMIDFTASQASYFMDQLQGVEREYQEMLSSVYDKPGNLYLVIANSRHKTRRYNSDIDIVRVSGPSIEVDQETDIVAACFTENIADKLLGVLYDNHHPEYSWVEWDFELIEVPLSTEGDFRLTQGLEEKMSRLTTGLDPAEVESKD